MKKNPSPSEILQRLVSYININTHYIINSEFFPESAKAYACKKMNDEELKKLRDLFDDPEETSTRSAGETLAYGDDENLDIKYYNPRTHFTMPLTWSDEQWSKFVEYESEGLADPGIVNPVIYAIKKVFSNET